MIKTILKYGFISTLILSLIKLLIAMPFLKPENVEPAMGILKFFIIAGCMYFAINNYLKHDNFENSYAYGVGIIICLGTGIFGILLYGFAGQMVAGNFNPLINLPTAIAGVILWMVPNLLMSLIIPAAFISRTKSQGQIDGEEILDANL